MIQTFTSSCFSSNLQLSQREKGSFTWLQPQRRHTRHTKILYRDKENKYLGFSCTKNLDLAESFSSNGNKRSHGKLLVQTHGTTSDGEFVLQPSDDHKVKLQSQTWMNSWDAFYRFCRPYTVYGVVVAVCSASLLPLTSVRDLSPALFMGMLQAMIPFILGNIYTSAINQLYDVEIDKINKPYLPLASGEFSMGQGKAIVLALAFTSLATGIMSQSLPLFIGVLLYLIIGTAYSIKLPYLRWKTNPYLAAFCMFVLCGITMQPAAFYHIQQNVLGKPVVLTKSLGFSVIFFSVFAIVLAMFKDIPDVEGDRAAGSRTFSVRHGKEKVFSTGVGILLFAYGYAVVIGASSSLLIYKLVSVIGHCTLASILLLKAKSINLDDNAATQSFYMFLWKLLYAEYVLIHFMR